MLCLKQSRVSIDKEINNKTYTIWNERASDHAGNDEAEGITDLVSVRLNLSARLISHDKPSTEQPSLQMFASVFLEKKTHNRWK